MMGTKERHFAPLIRVSLEELVPQDHFYRHLERTIDLSFVREFVHETYAGGGRPSIDPIVFFKLQLVLFFEGIRSERQLMRHAADRLSVRWYLGYDFGEPLPDHSSLTRIRERYGIEVFRRFFDRIVDQCQQEGLVWGQELYFDGTKVLANASTDSVKPRFFVEAHLAHLFAEEAEQPTEESPQTASQEEAAGSRQASQHETPIPMQLPPLLSSEVYKELSQQNEARHEWIEQLGAQDRRVSSKWYQRVADMRVSTTDPDASLMLTKDGAHLGYHTHYVVDGGKARIILQALVTPSEVMDNQPMLDLLWRVRFRWKLRPHQITGDTKYGTAENIMAIEQEGMRAYVLLPDLNIAVPTLANATSATILSKMSTSVRTTPSYICIPPHRLSTRSAIKPKLPPAIPVHSKPNARREPAGAMSAAISPKRILSVCVPTNRQKPTRKPCASAMCGSNRYLRKAKTGMACGVSAYANCGASTVRG